jgi:hypothetical protein
MLRPCFCEVHKDILIWGKRPSIKVDLTLLEHVVLAKHTCGFMLEGKRLLGDVIG